MARFKVYLEYEGTRYSGWQMQPNAKTIQGTIISACEKIFKDQKIVFQGSGRTDAGVHAILQVAHLDVKTMLAPEIIKLKLNDSLPYDINILEVEKTNAEFHSRHDALSRSYLYYIAKQRTAFGKNYVWWIKDKLNVNAMKNAAEQFKGMHDFVSFADEDKTEKSTKVLLEGIEIIEDENSIIIKIKGSHFLWKMVRRIVGVLVEVGRGRKNEKDIYRYLNSKSKEPAEYTAPPSGLFLQNVEYKEEKKQKKINSMSTSLFRF